ncbi:hypothetical protein HOO68_06040 [Candidatus Gracilibacteria bacterium]|nr:hypothetical protein [Candidatus Gracilibacteria bacterium]
MRLSLLVDTTVGAFIQRHETHPVVVQFYAAWRDFDFHPDERSRGALDDAITQLKAVSKGEVMLVSTEELGIADDGNGEPYKNVTFH